MIGFRRERTGCDRRHSGGPARRPAWCPGRCCRASASQRSPGPPHDATASESPARSPSRGSTGTRLAVPIRALARGLVPDQVVELGSPDDQHRRHLTEGERPGPYRRPGIGLTAGIQLVEGGEDGQARNQLVGWPPRCAVRSAWEDRVPAAMNLSPYKTLPPPTVTSLNHPAGTQKHHQRPDKRHRAP